MERFSQTQMGKPIWKRITRMAKGLREPKGDPTWSILPDRDPVRAQFDELLDATPQGQARRLQREMRPTARLQSRTNAKAMPPQDELLATYYALCLQMVRAGVRIPHGIPGSRGHPTLIEYALLTAAFAAAAISAIAVPQYIGAAFSAMLAVFFGGACAIGFVAMCRDYPQVRRSVLALAILAIAAAGVVEYQVIKTKRHIPIVVKHERRY